MNTFEIAISIGLALVAILAFFLWLRVVALERIIKDIHKELLGCAERDLSLSKLIRQVFNTLKI